MPFYGEAGSEKFLTLLSGHHAAVKEYSEATIAGESDRQDAALAHYGVECRRYRLSSPESILTIAE